MLTIDITINGRTIHKFLVGKGPQLDDGRHSYTIFDNNHKDLGMVAHDRKDRALGLAMEVLAAIDYHYGKEGPNTKPLENKLKAIRQAGKDMLTDPHTVRALEKRSKEMQGRF